ncbi:MAG: acylphosphatase [Butyricicoccaceae bacterium]
MTARWHLVLSGRVQGIGLRFRTKMAAQQLGLTGWISNMSNGDVELELQGEQHTIDRCLIQIRALPGVRIEFIHADELEPIPETRFLIR